MAFYDGPFDITGKVPGFRIFKRNGRMIIAKLPFVSKIRRKYSADFQRVRENSNEFGGSAKLCSKFYKSIGKFKYLFKMGLWNKLNGEFRRVLGNNTVGLRGYRGVNVLTSGETLLGYSLSTTSLDNLLRTEYEVNISPDRKSISAFIPEFSSQYLNVYRKNITHFRFVMSVTVLKKLEAIADKKKYQFDEAEYKARVQFAYADVQGKVSTTPETLLNIEFDAVPHAEDALIVCLGIELYESVEGIISLVKKEGGLQIVKIG